MAFAGITESTWGEEITWQGPLRILLAVLGEWEGRLIQQQRSIVVTCRSDSARSTARTLIMPCTPICISLSRTLAWEQR